MRSEDIPNFGTRSNEPLSPEAMEVLRKHDQEWMTEKEMEWWHELCKYQVQHHPDQKMKGMFQRLGLLTKMRRAVAQAACPFAISPNQEGQK